MTKEQRIAMLAKHFSAADPGSGRSDWVGRPAHGPALAQIQKDGGPDAA